MEIFDLYDAKHQLTGKTIIPYSKTFIEYLFFRSTHLGNFDTD